MKYKRYEGIDFLRTIGCIGIVMMHMLSEDNNFYVLRGFFFEKIVPSFTDFTFLFMTISAFGLSCGYRDKILKGEVDLISFYKKRYLRILPFFTVLVLIDLMMDFSSASLYEAIADVSLTYGLFPNNISVIGVGWFLGVIWAFYLLFPFFCVLIQNKKVAWFAFAISLVLNSICGEYFGLDRTNIVYSFCYFLLGGLIYLYKEKIEIFNYSIVLSISIISIGIYYIIGSNTFTLLFISAALMILAISRIGRWFSNRIVIFISGLSMEIYLSHMAVFRGLEKFHINTMFGNGLLQYMITVTVVFMGSMCFSVVITKMFEFAKGREQNGQRKKT